MSTKYPGGFITKSPVAPSGPYENSTAPGIWTVDQAMQYKKQDLWPTAGNLPPLVIGQVYGGGFYAGQISTAGNGIADFNLVVGPVASAQSSTLQWKTSSTATPGTLSVINGPANSAAMNNASHPAAQFCEAVTSGGFSDWYMPAKNELEVCYYNLKPTTNLNNTGSGINANAVPARASNYTSGTPAQTTAADFKSTGTEDFSGQQYWSSTESSISYYKAWNQGFYYGYQITYGKIGTRLSRAVRRVAV